MSIKVLIKTLQKYE